MLKSQLELGLVNHHASRVACPARRSARARWWFDRMRQVVDCAAGYPPAAGARPSPAAVLER